MFLDLLIPATKVYNMKFKNTFKFKFYIVLRTAKKAE